MSIGRETGHAGEGTGRARWRAWLADPRTRWGGALVLALFLLFFIVERALFGTSDIDTFHEAGGHLWVRGSLEPGTDIRRYPPPFHALMALFGWMPLWAVALARTTLNMALLADLPRRLYRLSGIPPRRQWTAWLVAAPFLVDSLLLGQHGATLLWLTTAGLAAARHGRAGAGGALIAVAGWMKVLPGGLIAIPLVLGRRLAAVLAGAGAATLLLFALLALFMGTGDGLRATASWWQFATEDYSPQSLVEHGNCLRYNNQSLPITLARTFGEVRGQEIRGAVRLASLPLPLLWGAHKVVLGVTGAVVLLLLGRLRGRGEDPDAWLGLFALVVTATMAASPLVWTYYFVWLLPGALYLGSRSRGLALGLFAAVVLGLLSPHLRGLGAHMLIAYVIFALVARDLWRRSAEPAAEARSAEASA